MALKRKLQDKDTAQEVILDSDSDAYTTEDEDISPPQVTAELKGKMG
jgi:hypothetical protein